MKLILQNFRNHNYFEHDFKDVTELNGSNGTGKTSILEAFVFALFGRDFYGSTGTDRYIQKGKADCTVVLQIGKDEVKRVITEKSTEIYLNGSKVVQGDIELKYGTLNSVLPGINPMYFMGLNDSDKRELFMKLLPQQDRREIFIEKYGSELVEKFMLMSERTAKSQYASLEQSITQNQTVAGQLAEQSRTDMQEVALLKSQLKVIDDSGNILDAQKELDELQSRIGRYGDIEANKQSLNNALEKLTVVVKEKLKAYGGATLTDAITQHQEVADRLEDKGEVVRQDLAESKVHVQNFESSIATGKCTTCGQEVSSDYAQKHLQEHVNKTSELTVMLGKINDAVEKEKDIVSELRGYLVSGKESQLKLKAVNDTYPQYEKDRDRIEELKGLLGDVSILEDIMSNKETEGRVKALESRSADAETRSKTLFTQVDGMKPQYEELKVILEAFSSKGIESEIVKRQTKYLTDLVNKKIDGIGITTTKENKSNEGYKEVFEISLNDVEFKSLSFGEKMKVSVAFCLSIQELQEYFNVPLLLLDEASVLSYGSMRSVESWCKKSKVTMVVTRVSNNKFGCEDRKYEN